MKAANGRALGILLLVACGLQLAYALHARISPSGRAFQSLNAVVGGAGGLSLFLLNKWTRHIWRTMMVLYTVYPLTYLAVPGAWDSYVALARAVVTLPGPVAIGTIVFVLAEQGAILGIGWIVDWKLHRAGA